MAEPLPTLRDAPADDQAAASWVAHAAGVVEVMAGRYWALADCIERHRAAGVIR